MLGMDNLHYHGCTQSSHNPLWYASPSLGRTVGEQVRNLAFQKHGYNGKAEMKNKSKLCNLDNWTESSLLRIREYTDKVLFLSVYKTAVSDLP
jgi:hypothetical protein